MSAVTLDSAKLKEELQRCTETRDKLLHTTTKMREMVAELEECLKNETSANSSSLRQQYEEQAEKNRQLEREMESLQLELAKKRGQRVGGPSKGLQAYDGMSQLALKQLLRKLEKEKVEIEWQLKEIEWRLDQGSSAVSKAEEEREAVRDQLAQLSQGERSYHVPTTTKDEKISS